LFSVTSVLVSRRTREIGLRKVNGATTADVMILLNSQFFLWFSVSFIIACPVAWYIMNRWLQSFANRTELSWWVFAVSGGVVMVLALVTVSVQCWKPARGNPVETVRYE
jgi:putative ABC transport system permease protein